MLELKNLGVVELSAQEKVEVEGGWIWVWFIVGLCIGLIEGSK